MALLTATNFDYLNARLHGMRSRLWEGDRLEDLCKRRSLSEVALASTGDGLAPSAGVVEKRLAAQHVDVLARIAGEMRGGERWFFRALIERYRVEDVKVIVRWRAAKEPVTSPAPFLLPMPEWIDVPYERLIAAPDMAALVEALPEEWQSAAATRGLEAFDATGSAFFVEAALDQEAFNLVIRRHADLPRSHRKATVEILERERVAYNVMFAARAATTYRLGLAEVEPYLAPTGPGTGADLARVHAAPTAATILEVLPASLTGGTARGEAADLAEVERRLWTGLAQMANRLFYGSIFSLGMATAFYYLKRVELFNLIRVVEGMRYGLPPAEIRQRMI